MFPLGRTFTCCPYIYWQAAVGLPLKGLLVDNRSMFCLADVRGEVWSATGQGFSLLFGRKSDSVTSLTEKIRNNSCQQRQVQHKFTILV